MFRRLLIESRIGPPAAAVSLLVLFLLLFWTSGTLTGDKVLRGYDSALQLVGQQVMFALMPPYLLLACTYATRHSLWLAAKIDAHLSEPIVRRQIEQLPLRTLLIGGCLGGVYAVLFNIPWYQWAEMFAGEVGFAAVNLGNLTVWVTVGVALAVRFSVATAFYHGGEVIEIDLYNPGDLKVFARNGLIDVLFVCGAMALTVLQALDAQFRWYNYAFAIPVAAAAIAIFMLVPVYSIHRRLVTMRNDEIGELSEAISDAPRGHDADSLVQLELLLARRDRLQRLNTWPIDLPMLSTILLYVVIPLIAWSGAAIVEMLIDAALAE